MSAPSDCKNYDLIISAFVSATIIFFTPSKYLTYSYTALGQAHFLLAYLYQFRAGKYNTSSSILYLIALVIITYASFTYSKYFVMLIICFFLLHNFHDELRLLKIKSSPLQAFYIMPLLINMILYNGYDSLIYDHKYFAYALLGISLVPLAITIWQGDKSYYSFHNSLSNIAVAAILFFNLLNYEYIWAYLLIKHGIMWYIKIGRDFYAKDSTLFAKYCTESVIVNLALILLITITNMGFLPKIFDTYFFSMNGYNVWALMHFITTLRPFDYFAIFPVRKLVFSYAGRRNI